MASATDFQSEATALELTSKYVILVSEQISDLQPNVTAGNRLALTADTYKLHFTLALISQMSRTLAGVTITRNVGSGSLPLYFLPWAQDAATEMTLPAGAVGPDIFMTSMLSGCTVRVQGPPTSPTVIHANARTAYSNAYTQQDKVLKVLDDQIPAQERHESSEARANSVATGCIESMMPANIGTPCNVRKVDYAAKITANNLQQARNRFAQTLSSKQSIDSYDMETIQLKPRLGAFVFGLRDALNNWAFYYQSAVEVEVILKEKKLIGSKTLALNTESAVLGVTERFYP